MKISQKWEAIPLFDKQEHMGIIAKRFLPKQLQCIILFKKIKES